MDRNLAFAAFLVLTAALAAASPSHAEAVSEASVAEWLSAYGQVWEPVHDRRAVGGASRKDGVPYRVNIIDRDDRITAVLGDSTSSRSSATCTSTRTTRCSQRPLSTAGTTPG